jgi:hypothetical protein
MAQAAFIAAEHSHVPPGHESIFSSRLFKRQPSEIWRSPLFTDNFFHISAFDSDFLVNSCHRAWHSPAPAVQSKE